MATDKAVNDKRWADGGPAFPVLAYDRAGSGDIRPLPTIELGMTLRDYFAAKALQGMLAASMPQAMVERFGAKASDQLIAEYLVSLSLIYADAMLDARKR